MPQTVAMNGAAADRTTLVAFFAIVVFGGLNGVAVRVSNAELDFLWGAALRFGLASLLLFGVVALRRVALPRGGALGASVLYGLIGFAAAYGLAYFGLIETPASVGMVILALVPFPLAIPNVPALAGSLLFGQAAALVPAANPIGIATSNGMKLTSGV